ncbi:MAG: DAK2 domain-containing protein [Christensenellales bacterium]
MIKIKTIDAVLFREMVNAGAVLLEKNRDAVNALNVFPVPDGDTGTNMSMTMMSAVKELNAKECMTAGEAAAVMAKGALRGARGNSGVILSQLYRGFSKSLAGHETITPIAFAEAMTKSAESAYKAVMKPREGTILTVARVIAEEALKQAKTAPEDYDALFKVILSSGEAILAKTQEMLPVLKQAGVVDAGGRGLLIIYAGYAAVLRGEAIDDALIDMSRDVRSEEGGELSPENSSFGYSVSYSLAYQTSDAFEADISGLRRRLQRIGDTVQVQDDMFPMLVQVCTDDPGKALQYGCALGPILDIDVKNLSVTVESLQQQQEMKKYGIVSVSLGDGFRAIFKDLGVDQIVDGGQTMNPSIENLEQAINAIHAENIFILPNNGNVFLAAKQAAELSGKKVSVLPTKNVAMGIAAIIAFEEDLDIQANEERMNEAAERVRTGTITFAVRDSEFEGLHISEGSIIGLNNGHVTVCTDSKETAALELMKQIVTDDDSVITVYYGQDTPEEEAQVLGQMIADSYDHCDVDVQNGGQPLYYYLLSVE